MVCDYMRLTNFAGHMEKFFLTLFSLLIIVLLFLPDGACTLYTGTLCARCLPQRKERPNRVRSQVMTGC